MISSAESSSRLGGGAGGRPESYNYGRCFSGPLAAHSQISRWVSLTGHPSGGSRRGFAHGGTREDIVHPRVGVYQSLRYRGGESRQAYFPYHPRGHLMDKVRFVEDIPTAGKTRLNISAAWLGSFKPIVLGAALGHRSMSMKTMQSSPRRNGQLSVLSLALNL